MSTIAAAASLLAGGTGPSPGADGVGDPYYPQDGNGGYRVSHYDVRLNYDPAKPDFLRGDTRIDAVTTQHLDRFDLDLDGFTVDSVTVNNKPAAGFTRTGEHELVITPAHPIDRGRPLQVRVTYSGKPGLYWMTADAKGAVHAFAEPHSATSWYPVDDHPSNKASFTLTTTVPTGWSVVGNGEPEAPVTRNGATTFVWNEKHPVASYLTGVVIDKFTLVTSHLADGTPVYDAYLPDGGDAAKPYEDKLPEVLDFLSSKFGRYPFSSAGGIFYPGDPDDPSNNGGGFELQDRPVYPDGIAPQRFTDIVHENAHQWFGDSVSVKGWKDICVKECFATYAEWLWNEAKQGNDLDADYLKTVAAEKDDPAFWKDPLYDPGADSFYGGAYTVGPLMLHALRRTVGDAVFFRTLRDFLREHTYGNASWSDFEQLAHKESGQDLAGFFQAWAHSTTVPADKYLYVVKDRK
ncbi:M1 family metallopeptidase [Streptacidiphilus sp. PAMC 29251]